VTGQDEDEGNALATRSAMPNWGASGQKMGGEQKVLLGIVVYCVYGGGVDSSLGESLKPGRAR